jgi:DNA repair protein RadA/Sms
MAKEKVIWSCQECGTKQAKWTGSCSACQQWNTFVEEVDLVETKKRFESSSTTIAKPMRIKEVTTDERDRIQTKLKEFDRLLGGGLVIGSLSLVAGDPGIGKSTLMLQIAESLASQGLTVLYICGEESVQQTTLRARRLKTVSENLLLYSETNFLILKYRSINSSQIF